VAISKLSASLACGLISLGFCVPAHAVDPVPADQFSKMHNLIKPKAGEEKWTQIPWLSSLWEARKKAAEQGKPILLWEMDGHPLGCT
jgi:hypothetical protein